MKKRVALIAVFFMTLLMICTAVLADDDAGCAHEWIETGVLRSEDVHDGSDVIICYRCSQCGEEHFETAPTDIPQECLYTMHDVTCANGSVSTTAVCIYCGKTRSFLTGPESVANRYADDNGNLYSFSGDLKDIPESVTLDTDAADETSEFGDDEQSDTDINIPSGIGGGWSYFDCSTDIDETALAAFEQAMPLLTDAEYSPCALLGTQVVAGTNYCFLAFKTPYDADALPCYTVVYLYCDLSGNVSVLSVTDIECTYDFAAVDETALPDEDAALIEDVTEPVDEDAALVDEESAPETAEEIVSDPEAQDPQEEVSDDAAAPADTVADTTEVSDTIVTEADGSNEEFDIKEETALAEDTSADPLCVKDPTTGEELFSAVISEDGLSLTVSLKDDTESNYWRCSIGDITVLQLESSSLTDFMDGTDVGALTENYIAVFKARVRADGTVKPGESVLTFSLVKNSTDKAPLTYFNLIVSVDENGVLSVETGDVPYTHTY